MNFLPLTSEDRKIMLEKIGASSFEALLQGIPKSIPRANLQLPPGLTEPDLLQQLKTLAQTNVTSATHVSFLGAGSYQHFIPSVVRYITSRGEFLTAYTPYQPEASQGTLQAMYEFQSLLCDLTGMDVANASLYDGASAVAEACMCALRHTERQKLVFARTVHPEYRQTVQTYLKRTRTEIVEAKSRGGIADLEEVKAHVDDRTAALIVQMPNALGCLESVQSLGKIAHEKGALFIVIVNPISLGVCAAPGSYGADIVVGEGQPLGTDLQYGGPYLGLFACTEVLMRKVPGRIVGMTRDSHGRRGFVLTLQTREQHIRRARATSNICTNEAMIALAAAVYLSALGKNGFREVANQNVLKSHYCFDELLKVPGIRPLFPSPFFHECALDLPIDPDLLNKRLLDRGFFGGFPLKRWEPDFPNGWLVCVTEVHSKNQIDGFVAAAKEALR